MAQPTITELAAIISANTAKIDHYLSSQGPKSPSFDVDAPTEPIVPSDAPELEAARSELTDATLMLHDLILGPKEYLMKLTHDWLISMQAISRFDITKSIPIHEEVSYADIAKRCSVNELDVRHILRHAIILRLCKESKRGVVAHTAASRMIAEDQQIADWTVNAIVKHPGSQELSETTDELLQWFALANGTDKSVSEVLSQNPARAKRFGSAMKAWTEGTGYDLQYVIDNYSWQEVGNGTVVDVGGSHGFACTRLAKAFHDLNFIVQDLPPVVEAGAKTIPLEPSDKIKFIAHDLLKDQPLKNANIYFFRWIFHN
ncbi:uncharacterized protein EAF01_007218 [Botrytis porri]|uniref:uncharacterized protein n=1 Tax=Botrytis porri TaxID=87229 RepID=UPI001901BF9C|nr:uncharacterized protein EAF01_007218 [Botrytis porri]KAF7901920.1 hypothetical protein EAF01_007218 [Botrytis porri]